MVIGLEIIDFLNKNFGFPAIGAGIAIFLTSTIIESVVDEDAPDGLRGSETALGGTAIGVTTSLFCRFQALVLLEDLGSVYSTLGMP